MYNKEPTLLRCGDDAERWRGLKVYRSKQGDPEGKRQWLDLRKTVADLPRRAELSQAANDRYLEALSTISADTPLSSVTDKVCRTVELNGRRHRGLRPFDPEEVRLLEAVSRGEFLISGFRNRDVRGALYGPTEEALQRRREAGRVSRKLALLRAHGLIKKIPRAPLPADVGRSASHLRDSRRPSGLPRTTHRGVKCAQRKVTTRVNHAVCAALRLRLASQPRSKVRDRSGEGNAMSIPSRSLPLATCHSHSPLENVRKISLLSRLTL
jgi:hypothetical protein